eukprot:snap_masked-scaffold_30-processed-gene-2.33-mRNA-1 protein AED:1.00 eAED:1.00 QI:0/0/0/0/1/1/2/0/60
MKRGKNADTALKLGRLQQHVLKPIFSTSTKPSFTMFKQQIRIPENVLMIGYIHSTCFAMM